MEDSWSVKNLIDFAVESTQRACADDVPFHHLSLDRVFPDDFYAAMLQRNAGGERLPSNVGKNQDGKQQA